MQDVKELVLLVDDDFSVRKTHAKVLTRAGFAVEAAASGADALSLLEKGLRPGAIITDLHMPGIDGIAFLKAVRRIDLDVPVIVITGYPSIDSAVRTLEYGGFRYLTKPAGATEVVSGVRDAVVLHRLALAKRRALELYESHRWQFGDIASLEAAFDATLDQLWMAYQPIVHPAKREVVGYEALVRSYNPLLSTPGPLLDAAERLGRMRELGQRIRRHVVDAVSSAPDDTLIFVNLHSADLNDDTLFDRTSGFSACSRRIVLEITERSSLANVKDVKSRAQHLRQLGFKLAIDDLGAGYAGLSSFTQLDPDIAKLDMSLIRDIHASPQKQSIVKSMLDVCQQELGISVVTEGVETRSEQETLEALGAQAQQGYLFGRPRESFSAPSWAEA
jgi:EAL domain-containing protein (putative c-di-GMP-specific phosphodiesterase class I)/AmiR/NasT family two-component response regulator